MQFRAPKPGEIRVKSKFAFFPVRINDRYVWLENYKQFQICTLSSLARFGNTIWLDHYKEIKTKCVP